MSDLISRTNAIKAMDELEETYPDGFTGEQARTEICIIPTVSAIPISVIEDIKAEIKELIDWHDCPMKLDNGNDAWYCEACNMAISIIDKHIKEYTE